MHLVAIVKCQPIKCVCQLSLEFISKVYFWSKFGLCGETVLIIFWFFFQLQILQQNLKATKWWVCCVIKALFSANRNKSRLLFSSAEMFKKPLWRIVWTQIRLPSVDPDQTAYSGSILFASILNSLVTLGNYLQQRTSADNIFRYIFFLGALKGIATLTITMFYMKDLNKPWILKPVSSKPVGKLKSCRLLNICKWTNGSGHIVGLVTSHSLIKYE